MVSYRARSVDISLLHCICTRKQAEPSFHFPDEEDVTPHTDTNVIMHVVPHYDILLFSPNRTSSGDVSSWCGFRAWLLFPMVIFTLLGMSPIFQETVLDMR